MEIRTSVKQVSNVSCDKYHLYTEQEVKVHLHVKLTAMRQIPTNMLYDFVITKLTDDILVT